MKPVVRGCVGCMLFLVLWTGTVYPSTDSKADFEPSSKCCDIAFMDAFRSNRLLYARTPEFVEAVRAVASGTSKYSPRNGEGIPFAAWNEFATEMRRHSAADTSDAVGPSPSADISGVHGDHGNLRLLSDERSLIPALVYLASLEYRSRPGHEGIRPILPRVFRAAVAELEGRLAEKRRMAEAFARRAAAVRSRIAEAERTAAGRYTSADLARAKSELERARRDALGVRSSMLETDTAFARAEKIADALLTR